MSQKQDIGPSPRGYHAMTYDSKRHKTLLFGGVAFPNEYLNDTWVWDGKFWTQRQDIGPQKGSHSIAYDSQRKHAVMFGGTNNTVALSDTWELKVELHPE